MKTNELKTLKSKVEKINKHLENLHLIAEAFEIYFVEYEKWWEYNIEEFNEKLFGTDDHDGKYCHRGPKIHIWNFKRYSELKPCIGYCQREQYAFVGSSGNLMFGRLDHARPTGDALELIEKDEFQKHDLSVEALKECVDGIISWFIDREKATVKEIAKFITTEMPQFYLSYGGGQSGHHHDGEESPYIEFLLGLSFKKDEETSSGSIVREFRVCRLAVQYWLNKKYPFYSSTPNWLRKGFNGKETVIRVVRFKNFEGAAFEVDYDDGTTESWLWMDRDWTEKQQYLSEQLFDYFHEAWVCDWGPTFQLEHEWDYDHDRLWGTTNEKRDLDLIRWTKKGWYPWTVYCNHASNPNYFRQVLGDSNKPLLEHYEKKLDQFFENRRRQWASFQGQN